MSYARDDELNRRGFLRALGVTGISSWLGLRSGVSAAEPPPETTTLRLVYGPSICVAPAFVAEDLLRGEGFRDIQWVKRPTFKELNAAMASGEADLGQNFAANCLVDLEAGHPLVMIGGVHIGCFELIGTG